MMKDVEPSATAFISDTLGFSHNFRDMGHCIRMIIQFGTSPGTHQIIYDHVTAWNDAELSIPIDTIDEWPNKRPRVPRKISSKNKDPKTNNRNVPKYETPPTLLTSVESWEPVRGAKDKHC
jgi:hypothetical protein